MNKIARLREESPVSIIASHSSIGEAHLVQVGPAGLCTATHTAEEK